MGFVIGEKQGNAFLIKHERSIGHCEAILKVNSTEDISTRLNAARRDYLKARITGLSTK